MAEINEKPERSEKRSAEAPKDSAITSDRDQKTVLDLQHQAKDSADTPSGIMKRLTGKEFSKLAMVDSADSPSMEAMQAIQDPKVQQELGLRRGIRQTMEPGPDRDEAERITKEVMRAKEVVPPVEVTVEKGDSLWKIARSHLGNAVSDQEIANHVENIVKINDIKNPDLIYPGQRFRLPGYTVEGRVAEPKDYNAPINRTDKELSEKIVGGPPLKDRQEKPRKELLMLAASRGVDNLKLTEAMQNLENRQKVGTINENELLETYKQVGRIVDGEGSALLNQTERNSLAVQVLDQAGRPTSIDQGRHSTCTVTALESRIYTRHPEMAAKLVADVALNGQYTDSNGYKVSLNPKSEDPESVLYPEKDGNRSHASELFQVTAVNLFWARENGATGRQIRYEQRAPSATAGDTGELLIDYSKKPPQELDRKPDLPDEAVQSINQYITGESSDGIIMAQRGKVYGSDEKMTTFQSEEEFRSKLIELHDQGKFPVLLSVFSYNNPWWSDSGGGEAGGSAENLNSRHMVSITDLEMGPPVALKIDNQWGSKFDHAEKDRTFSFHDLYTGTIEPFDSFKILKADTTANRENKIVDSTKELELVRLKHAFNEYGSEEEFGDAVRTVVRTELTKWNQQKESGIDDTSRRAEELQMVKDLVNSTDDRTCLLAQLDANQLGYMPDAIYDSKVAAYGIKACTRPPEQKETNLQNFRYILAQLPSNRAHRIIDQFEAANKKQ